MVWSTKKKCIVISLVVLVLAAVVIVLLVIFLKKEGQNVVVTPTDFAIAVNGEGLITRQLPDGKTNEMDLPKDIDGFRDVTFDVENSNLIFALSTSSQRVCSYLLSSSTLTLVNCAGSNIPVSPFVGIAAYGGNLVISGGTGGLSVFTYDTTDGTINDDPAINGQRLDVVGLPDVQMLSSTVIAFSADLGGSPRFGIPISQIVDGNVEILREFRVDGAGFSNAIGPANFAFVNAIATRENGDRVVYTANGIMTVVDPSQEGSVTVIQGPAGFAATTVAVNVDGTRVVFGGLIAGGSIYIEYDATDNPLSPILLQSTGVQGRITSIGVGNNFIAASSDDQVIASFPLSS